MITLNPDESKSVVINAKEYWNHTGIKLEKDKQYFLKAEGTWVDWYIEIDANGFGHWFFLPVEILRRMPTKNWFALIGTLDKSRENAFLIGTGPTDYTPPIPGELVCFANDVPGFYWNNYGSIYLTVTRKT
jgi:hypothetical protein